MDGKANVLDRRVIPVYRRLTADASGAARAGGHKERRVKLMHYKHGYGQRFEAYEYSMPGTEISSVLITLVAWSAE